MNNFWTSMWSPIRSWWGGRQASGTQLTGPDGYGYSASVEVTAETALQVTAVWACINLYARTFASLPLRVYRKTDDGRVEDPSHWFAKLMRGKPNQYQTRYEFWEHQIANLVLHGNLYAKRTMLGGQLRSLLPLNPLQVETRLIDGKVVHLFSQDGSVTALAADSVWHARMNGDLIVGRSPLQFGRNAIGIAQAAELSVSKIYASGGKRSGTITFDRLLTPEQRAQIRANFTGLTDGDERLVVLEAGGKFEPTAMSPQDIELLASRKYNNDDIARLFGVPSILINQNEGSTTLGSSTGEIIAAFYKTGLSPVAEAVENSFMTHLWSEQDRETHEAEFDFDNLLRASQKDRYETYRTGIASGVLKPNEARAMEWLPKAEGGDQLLVQGAMVPVKDAGKVPASPATKPPMGEESNGTQDTQP